MRETVRMLLCAWHLRCHGARSEHTCSTVGTDNRFRIGVTHTTTRAACYQLTSRVQPNLQAARTFADNGEGERLNGPLSRNEHRIIACVVLSAGSVERVASGSSIVSRGIQTRLLNASCSGGTTQKEDWQVSKKTHIAMTTTMTMTHSSKVFQQWSGGLAHNPAKKNLTWLYALLNGQGRLLVLCWRQCTESRVKKRQRSVRTRGRGSNSVKAISRDSGKAIFRDSGSHRYRPRAGRTRRHLWSNRLCPSFCLTGLKITQTCKSSSTRCSSGSFQWQAPYRNIKEHLAQSCLQNRNTSDSSHAAGCTEPHLVAVRGA